MKITTAFILLILTTNAYSQQITSRDLIGVWDMQKPYKLTLYFIDSIHVTYVNYNKINNKPDSFPNYIYSIDRRYMPNKIHFKNEIRKHIAMESYHLIKLVTGDTLKMQWIFDYNEPLKWQDDSVLTEAHKTQIFIKRK